MSTLENNTEKLNELKQKANSLPDYPLKKIDIDSLQNI